MKKVKIVAYMPLLYGLAYIEYAIRSVIDYVDQFHVIYSPVGAHGTRTSVPCPDSRNDLRLAALRGAGAKLRWHDAGPFTNEGDQREMIHEYAADADVILPVDYDEIWQPGLPELVIEWALSGIAHTWRVPMRHYYRSFYRCILNDPVYPTRAILANGDWHHGFQQDIEESTLSLEETNGLAINHFGYAISVEMMRWKMSIHGHRSEIRPGYVEDIYAPNRLTDCHPCNNPRWNPVTVNPADYMPEFMRSHPYWGMEVIP